MLATGGLTGASGSVISVVVGTRSWATGEGSSSMALGSGVDNDAMHPSSAGGSICSCSSGAGSSGKLPRISFAVVDSGGTSSVEACLTGLISAVAC
jgi:hypothetical protein